MRHNRYPENQVEIRYFETENILDFEEKCTNEEIRENHTWAVLKEMKGENLVRGVSSLGALMEKVESEEECGKILKWAEERNADNICAVLEGDWVFKDND